MLTFVVSITLVLEGASAAGLNGFSFRPHRRQEPRAVTQDEWNTLDRLLQYSRDNSQAQILNAWENGAAYLRRLMNEDIDWNKRVTGNGVCSRMSLPANLVADTMGYGSGALKLSLLRVLAEKLDINSLMSCDNGSIDGRVFKHTVPEKALWLHSNDPQAWKILLEAGLDVTRPVNDVLGRAADHAQQLDGYGRNYPYIPFAGVKSSQDFLSFAEDELETFRLLKHQYHDKYPDEHFACTQQRWDQTIRMMQLAKNRVTKKQWQETRNNLKIAAGIKEETDMGGSPLGLVASFLDDMLLFDGTSNDKEFSAALKSICNEPKLAFTNNPNASWYDDVLLAIGLD